MNVEALKEIAAQLRAPSGEKGIEVAEMMSESNFNMTQTAIACLNLQDNECVLELGHGNGKHIAELIRQKNNLKYLGLDISELMHSEAQKNNQNFIESNQAEFILYDGIQLPFEENSFDKIFTVNTIYFWNDPKYMLNELYRVLKPQGTICISYALDVFMKTLPFTQYGFKLYNNETVRSLVLQTPLQLVDIQNSSERIKNNTGELVSREFASCILTKI